MRKKKIKIPYFLLFIIGFFAFIIYLKNTDDPSILLPDEQSIEPDKYLDKATDEFAQNHTVKGREEIEKAIQSMKELERSMDNASDINIDLAIAKLKDFERHIKGDSLNSDELDYTFAHAINALALTQLKLSRFDLEHGKKQEAKIALKTVMSHLYNSMKYSDSLHEKEEVGLITQVESLIDSIDHQRTYERKLTEIIAEVQKLVDS